MYGFPADLRNPPHALSVIQLRIRYCEEQSDEAMQLFARPWIAARSPPLLQFRRRRTVEHLALGAFEQIERVGFDRQRPAHALEFGNPLDPRKNFVQIRPPARPRLV